LFTWIPLSLAALAALGLPLSLNGGWPLLPPTTVAFQPRARDVTNWRTEAVAHLDLDWRLTGTLMAGRDAFRVSRCVRLNNYWCIKRAGWAGEIAADREDHVAFASAIEGADVAAALLRRYYLDFGRHSALDIVSRWAPASCGAPAATAARRTTAQADHLAAHGLGNTLRARFLASRGRHGRHSAGRLRRSVVPDHALTLLRAPAIAVGLGEKPVALPPVSGVSAATIAALGAAPARTCAGDTDRIRNYASQAAAGLAPSIRDDLKLFTPEGLPTPHLKRLMLNMAAVEIGPLGVRAGLVEAAIAQLPARPRPPAPATPAR
jgi:hypothetical protein